MTNLQIKYYIKVFELLSITAAAEELYVSRPVISRVINELESEFNTVLFERMPRGLKPTESGVAVYKLFISTLKNYETTLERLKHIDDVKGNSLIRVGVLTTNIKLVYNMVIKGYQELYPNVRFSIIERSLENTLDALQQNLTDFIFIPMSSTESLDRSFTAYSMFYNNMVLAVSKNHPLKDKKIATIEDLLDIPLGIRDTTLPNNAALNSAFELYGRTPNITIRTSSTGVLKDMTESGKCCSILTEAMASDWGDVVTIPVNIFKRLHYYLVWNHSIPMSDSAESFIEYAKNHSLTQLI